MGSPGWRAAAAAETEAVLEIENLNKSFDGFAAVAEVSLTVAPRETHAVIGPNGAGKTTLFNLVTGHLKPDRGRVSFYGQPLTGLPHEIVRLGVARSFQRINIFPRLTVAANVEAAVIAQQRRQLRLFGSTRKTWSLAEELLSVVGLGGEGGRVAGELAYGQQKQLELALALALEPHLLLLDEPTAGMSAEETRLTTGLIKRIQEARGLSLLFTEHDMEVVFGIADRISVLHHGELIASGTPPEIRADPKVRAVYLGEGE